VHSLLTVRVVLLVLLGCSALHDNTTEISVAFASKLTRIQGRGVN